MLIRIIRANDVFMTLIELSRGIGIYLCPDFE